MFSLGSAAITWSSRKQPTIALSSIEAKYRGVVVIACEVAWLQMLLHDLDIQVQRPVVIYCDNLSRIQLARNLVFHARTKHIEVHYHFIKDRVLDGDIDLTYVRTDEQVADIFMKALGTEKLRQFQAMHCVNWPYNWTYLWHESDCTIFLHIFPRPNSLN